MVPTGPGAPTSEATAGGTVARTKRIPVEERAEAAVIAWMPHQTTGCEGMVIPKVRGKRREVRRTLVRRSQELLACYRRAEWKALANPPIPASRSPGEEQQGTHPAAWHPTA
jgi:hypothetical protein